MACSRATCASAGSHVYPTPRPSALRPARYQQDQVFESSVESHIRALTLLDGGWFIRLDGDLAGRVTGAVYDASGGDTELVPIPLSVGSVYTGVGVAVACARWRTAQRAQCVEATVRRLARRAAGVLGVCAPRRHCWCSTCATTHTHTHTHTTTTTTTTDAVGGVQGQAAPGAGGVWWRRSNDAPPPGRIHAGAAAGKRCGRAVDAGCRAGGVGAGCGGSGRCVRRLLAHGARVRLPPAGCRCRSNIGGVACKLASQLGASGRNCISHGQ
jgi:hypothetical protein